jgi:hypothetical protein
MKYIIYCILFSAAACGKTPINMNSVVGQKTADNMYMVCLDAQCVVCRNDHDTDQTSFEKCADQLNHI